MAKITITTQSSGYRCEKCGHEWVPRVKDREPVVCPKCKSPYWRTPGTGKSKKGRGKS